VLELVFIVDFSEISAQMPHNPVTLCRCLRKEKRTR
jgi:hypothetical protein